MSEHHYTHGYSAAVMAGHRRRTAENAAALTRGELAAQGIEGSEVVLADSLQRHGLMDSEDREQAARAFEQWARQSDGWFSVLHGEILARA